MGCRGGGISISVMDNIFLYSYLFNFIGNNYIPYLIKRPPYLLPHIILSCLLFNSCSSKGNRNGGYGGCIINIDSIPSFVKINNVICNNCVSSSFFLSFFRSYSN